MLVDNRGTTRSIGPCNGILAPHPLLLLHPGLGHNIFENERISVKYGNYTSSLFQAPIAPRTLCSSTVGSLPRPHPFRCPF